MTHSKPERVSSRFPRQYIKNIGAGTVGTIYLHRNETGEIERAEAKLEDAPFKNMIITSPRVLQIFGDDGETINFDVLKHPAPEFRLVEHEAGNFETGLLQTVEYVRTNDRIGIVPKERASSTRVSIIASTAPPPRPKSRTEKPAVLPTRTSGRSHGGPFIELYDSKPASAHSPSPQTSSDPYQFISGERAPPGTDVPAVMAEMEEVKSKVLEYLSEEDQEKYVYLLTRGAKTMSKAGQAARDKMRVRLREVLELAGDSFEAAASLHNEYAELVKQVETRLTHQIPKVDLP